MKRTAAALAALTAISACGTGGPSRQDVVEPIVSERVPALFADFGVAAAEVSADVDDWCENGAAAPTEAIEQLRMQWYATKPFWSGPVMDRRAQFTIDFKAGPPGIDELLASTDPVDTDSLRNTVGADKRGLGALTYLVDGGAPDLRRCEYATGVIGLVVEQAAAIADDWLGYGDESVTDEMSANDALRDIVSNAAFAVRQVVAGSTPELDAGLLSGARLAVLGDEQSPGITELLDDATIEQLTAEFDSGDADAVDLTLSTNVVGELGLTLNFSDADGDGG